MKKIVSIILLSVFVLSCSSNDDNSVMDPIESTLIAKGSLGGNGGEGIVKQNLIITDQNTWDSLIAQLDSVNNVSDTFSELDIDFTQYTVIAAFDEIKNNGGHSLELDIMANSENIVVRVTDLAPQGNTTTVMAQPFNIVKILNSDLPILFE